MVRGESKLEQRKGDAMAGRDEDMDSKRIIVLNEWIQWKAQ